MAADSGHMGQNPKDKVVPLRRHILVAEIEDRLSEARRLFSLHDYQSCDKLAREILRKDPQNTKAKAILELASIKLTGAKHALKLEGSPASEEQTDTAKDKDSPHLSLPASKESEEEADSKNSIPEHGREFHEAEAPTEAEKSTSIEYAPTVASSEPISRKDSLRERTISALVELFQRKDLSLADWKDPRFQLNGQPKAGKTQEAVRQAQTRSKLPMETFAREDKHPLPSEPPLGSGGSRESGFIFETQEIPNRKLDSDFNLQSPAKPSYQQWVARKFEERSEDLRKSEIMTMSIAQIKNYLYQEEYELCAKELESIRAVFPDNREIQIFVENTHRRLTELQRIKNQELQSRDLMSRAISLYQEGKLAEAVDAANEALRLVPNNQQAKEFVAFVDKRIENDKKKASVGKKFHFCRYCGVAVDSMSQVCFRCGKRLT